MSMCVARGACSVVCKGLQGLVSGASPLFLCVSQLETVFKQKGELHVTRDLAVVGASTAQSSQLKMRYQSGGEGAVEGAEWKWKRR